MARSEAVRVFRINTGSCGGCDLVIEETTRASDILVWADDPYQADVLLVTGPVTPSVRPAFLALVRELGGRIPLVAVGRCAIDGHPFGRGGLLELRDVVVSEQIDGCPVTAEQLVDVVRRVARQPARA
ncbi:MAG TPA: NADH:ubiquinone oxidoreductase [Roseiflexaceae bacterium]|nr:NADH:ubiquinone oxidoreductase [Roseiflexaceae bacterium]